MENKIVLLEDIKKSTDDIELSNNKIVDNGIRIGTDTTLWDILQTDANIVFFSRICGYSFRSESTMSLFYNMSWKVWYFFLISLLIVGEAGYIYTLLTMFSPQYLTSCHKIGLPVVDSYSAYISVLFVLGILPLSQLVTVLYSYYSIKELLSQPAEMDNLLIYQSSLRGSIWYLGTMLLNVIIIWFVTLIMDPSCIQGGQFMMSCFNFSTTCYTSFAVFVLASNINRITAIQEEILHQARNGALTNVS
jgi:hypothetical protein